MKFNVVCGNPPYQAPKVKTKDVTGMSGSKLWPEFAKLAVSLTKEGGHVCLVHPGQWRKPEHNLFQLFKDHNLLHLDIHDIKDGMKDFQAATGYDWYILANNKYAGKTVVRGVDKTVSTIDLNNWNFIPNSCFDIIEKLLANKNEK